MNCHCGHAPHNGTCGVQAFSPFTMTWWTCTCTGHPMTTASANALQAHLRAKE